MKTSFKKNEFKISASTWNNKIELPGGSYSVPNIQDYFEHIIKKHWAATDIPPIRIYISKIENRIKIDKLNQLCINSLTS